MSDALSVKLDVAWWPLGDGRFSPAQVAEALVADKAADQPEPIRDGLRSSLIGYGEWAATLAPGQRRSYALVQRPEIGRAEALLSLRLTPIRAGDYEKYLGLARSVSSTASVELVNQSVEEVAIAGGRGIAIHDFVLDREPGIRRPARERANVAFFPDSGETLLELHIATIDLALFDDMTDYAIRLLAGEVVGVPGHLEIEGADS